MDEPAPAGEPTHPVEAVMSRGFSYWTVQILPDFCV